MAKLLAPRSTSKTSFWTSTVSTTTSFARASRDAASLRSETVTARTRKTTATLAASPMLASMTREVRESILARIRWRIDRGGAGAETTGSDRTACRCADTDPSFGRGRAEAGCCVWALFLRLTSAGDGPTVPESVARGEGAHKGRRARLILGDDDHGLCRAPRRAVVDGLDVVPVGVKRVRAVVAGVVVVALSGRAVVGAAGGQRGLVEAADAILAGGLEGEVEAAGRLAVVGD